LVIYLNYIKFSEKNQGDGTLKHNNKNIKTRGAKAIGYILISNFKKQKLPDI